MAERAVPALACGLALALLAGCASGPRGGRDGPPSDPPAHLSAVPDAEPRIEAIRGNGGTSKPYSALGRTYTPITDDRPLRETGLASWYGRQFHGQQTASGEPYDMYAMTAAHRTLPLPSYVRVRNPANGRAAIVRVNDRGPFRDDRVIDLSYTAALKLDLLRGVAPVEIERITNEDIRTGAWRREGDVRLAAAPAAPARPEGVAVPVAWTLPVAAAPAEPMAATLLAQAPTGATASDAGPPPRFRDMQVTDLPPAAPLAAPTPAPAASSPAPAPAAAPGFWVQLGAFRERDGAEALQARATRSVPSLTAQLRVFSEAGTYRLQAGPFASREAAGGTVGQLRDSLGIAPLVVERR